MLIYSKKNYYLQLSNTERTTSVKKSYLLFILYIFGVITYLLSLHEIEGVGMTCFKRNRIECLFILIILTFMSSFFISISIYLILFKNYRKIHILIILFIYFIFYFIDHNAQIIEHGLFNFIGFAFCTIFLFLILCLLNLFYYLIKKRKFFIIFTLLFSFNYLIFKIKRYKLNHFSCDNWAKGLNNSYIDNSSKDYPCNIDIPKPHSCYIPEIGPYFDFSKLYRPTCLEAPLIRYDRYKFLNDMKNLKYLNISKKNHFGYPLTNNMEFKYDLYGSIVRPGNKSFENEINDKVILMDLYNKNKEKYYPNVDTPEIQIFLTKDGGKIEFNIKKNMTLIKEREEISKKKKLKYKNIIIMFLDTLSRAHFLRKFPKTKHFFEQFSKYEPNPLKKNISVFQFFKYQSIHHFTDPNIKAAYYGAKVRQNGIHFANYFKNNGYIIGRVNTFCEKEIVFDSNNPSKLKAAVWDHEGLSLGCIKSLYGRFLISRLSCLIEKCLFGKDLNQHALGYLESFWTSYINQYKLFLFQSLDGHEPTGELIGYFDKILYNFLNKFYNKGFFRDTAIIIFSDHGQHLNGPLYLFDSQDFNHERNLPALFLLLPNNENLYKNNLFEKIKSNQQTLITPFDIYNTLIDLACGENKEEYKKYSVSYGESLFNELNYKKRYCESPIYQELQLQIPKGVCKCHLK